MTKGFPTENPLKLSLFVASRFLKRISLARVGMSSTKIHISNIRHVLIKDATINKLTSTTIRFGRQIKVTLTIFRKPIEKRNDKFII